MSLSKRVTGGLAWAGLLLVVAVPSADAITAVFIPKTTDALTAPSTDQASLAAEPALVAPIPATRRNPPVVTEEAQTPAVEPVVEDVVTIDPVQTAGIDAVDQYLEQGKQLPAYISEAELSTEAATNEPTPEPVVETPIVPETEVATIEPTIVPETETVILPETDVAAIEPAVEPEIIATPVESAIDPVTVASIDPQVDLIAPTPMPASMRPEVSNVAALNSGSDDVILPDDEGLGFRNDRGFASNDRIISADELEDWESGPLSEFLERQQRDSHVTIRQRSSDFDEDGFFLDEGPNRRRFERELIGPVDDDGFFIPFLN